MRWLVDHEGARAVWHGVILAIGTWRETHAIRLVLSLLFCILPLGGCEETNLFLAADAAKDAVTAATLSDEDVRNLARQASMASDAEHHLAPESSGYARRLARLTDPHLERDGIRFNFKVYLTDQVNAFAMADGTIRVYSGLMDLMDDGELLFIVGHEMGHVVEEHSRKKVVMAYASSALRKGLASQNSEVGDIARSVLGGFVQQLTNAQFSQHEERQADRYGVLFLKNEGYDIEAARTSLEKLAELARNHTFLSSHPHPGARAEKVLAYAEDDGEDEAGLLSSLYAFAKALMIWLVELAQGLARWLLSFIL